MSLIGGCRGPLSTPGKTTDKSNTHKAVVREVINAAGYSYLNVTEKRKSTWLAVPGMEISTGDVISYSGGMEMTNFHSKELNRTFPSVLFLEGITNESKPKNVIGMNKGGKMAEVKQEKVTVSVSQKDGSVSIAKIFETKADLSGKTVKVRGLITKINSAIMGRNWIHIQDGTDYNGAFDLTVTSDSNLQVGDTVTLEGKITLKKDFGYGYIYEVIMEEGKPVR